MTKQWGATPDEWIRFAELFGASELLPTVCNPEAHISDKSSIRKAGKVPTCYNNDRRVVGIKSWTSLSATHAHISAWSKEPDYGVCVQTRRIVALDVDVDDSDASIALFGFFQDNLADNFLVRRRDGSDRFLIPVLLGPHKVRKDAIPTPGGRIELLGEGNQFVACGVHVDGARYEWWGETLQALSEEDLKSLWVKIAKEFGVGYVQKLVSSNVEKAADGVSQHLKATGRVLQEDAVTGKLMVTCPWSAEHTTDTGVAQSVWFPPHTGGYEKGHYHCLHAHCVGRSDADFMTAIEYKGAENAESDLFGSLEDDAQTDRTAKTRLAKIAAHIRASVFVFTDDFTNAQLMRGAREADCRDPVVPHAPDDSGLTRPLTNSVLSEMQAQCETSMQCNLSRERFRQAVDVVCLENHIDSYRDWHGELAWDGVSRRDFLSRWWGADDTEYTRALADYILTGLTDRCVNPGGQLDITPVLIGPQGVGKSRAIQALCPFREWFAEYDLSEKGVETLRQMQSVAIGVFDEFAGWSKRDTSSLKAFLTKSVDKFRGLYEKTPEDHPRRIFFFATGNHDEFLSDETGNRRFAALNVTGQLDVAETRKWCSQLWAEGKWLWESRRACGLSGLAWEGISLAAGAEAERNSPHMVESNWTEALRQWLDGRVEDREGFSSVQLLTEAIGMPLIDAVVSRHINELRIAMSALGYVKKRIKIAGLGLARWIKR